jgi:hypothetical protein
MIRPISALLLCAATLLILTNVRDARAQDAYGTPWGRSYTTQDWNRFYHYPYVYYPENFWGNDYYRSSGNLYFRYPPEMQIPVYNKRWHNDYPQAQRYYKGHQFILDVF